MAIWWLFGGARWRGGRRDRSTSGGEVVWFRVQRRCLQTLYTLPLSLEPELYTKLEVYYEAVLEYYCRGKIAAVEGEGPGGSESIRESALSLAPPSAQCLMGKMREPKTRKKLKSSPNDVPASNSMCLAKSMNTEGL